MGQLHSVDPSIIECVYNRCKLALKKTRPGELFNQIITSLKTTDSSRQRLLSELSTTIDPLDLRNIIKDETQIKEGVYGKVYMDIDIQNNSVIKKCNNLCIDEMFIGLLLCCIFMKEKYQPFPEIYLLFRDGTVKPKGCGISCILEKLEISLFDYIVENIEKPKIFIPILIQICELLEYLQENFKYIHGDLHSSNVLLNKNKNPKFIDAGVTSLDLTKIGLKMRLISESGPAYKKIYTKAYDLRLLFGKIFNDIYYQMGHVQNSFSEYLNRLFGIFDKTKIEQNEFYKIMDDDTNFHPLVIKENLEELMKGHDERA